MILSYPAPPRPAPKRASAAAIVQRYRISGVAPGRALSYPAREALAHDLLSLRRQLIIDGGRTLAPYLARCFHETLGQICDRAPAQGGFARASADLLSPAADRRLIAAYTPLVQSIAARACHRACLFFGAPSSAAANLAILRRAQQQAKRITRLHTILREHLAAITAAAGPEGRRLDEAILRLRQSIPDLAVAHVPALARHEVSRAINEGIEEALRSSRPFTPIAPLACSVGAAGDFPPHLPTMARGFRPLRA